MSSPKILICYSNPADKSRVRLDIEHGQIEAVISKSGMNSSCIKRIHASRLEDIVVELGANNYEILQFSGHGSEEGIYLENNSRTSSELVDFEAIKRILLVASSLRVLVLTCCFSSSYRTKLSSYIPYLISVNGPVPDVAAIQFSKFFYTHLLCAKHTIEQSFEIARTIVLSHEFSIHLNRRGLLAKEGEIKLEAVVGLSHKIILDITPLRTYLNQLAVTEKEHFLRAICQSLRTHFTLFKKPMENIAIPFGEYIGMFS